MIKKIVEICCGSYYDGLQAAAGGAGRIELNSALHLGGLTPSLAELVLLKRDTRLNIVAMIRPRGAGFYYHEYDFETMCTDCELLLKYGADGIAFGCLKADRSICAGQTRRIIDLIKAAGKNAVFHRAFDCVPEPEKAMEQLIQFGVDRVLTSGLKEKATDGADMIAKLQRQYGSQIEILAGSGINDTNAADLILKTGIHQIHSSCKTWLPDLTTASNEVSFAYIKETPRQNNGNQYEAVSAELVKKLINSIQ